MTIFVIVIEISFKHIFPKNILTFTKIIYMTNLIVVEIDRVVGFLTNFSLDSPFGLDRVFVSKMIIKFITT